MSRTRGAFTKARPNGDARQRAWAAMRYMGVFTAPQIQIGAEIDYENLRKYLRALEQAGYVKRRKAKRNGSPAGHVQWVLIRNTGPKHPIIRRYRQGVYDPNTDEVFPASMASPGTDSSDDRGPELARRPTPSL